MPFLCICVYNLSNNNTSIFKNILLSYFSISLLHNVDLCFKSQTLAYMKEKETNYPKWKQPPLEERWGHSLEDTSLTVTSQFRFYLGTLASGRKDSFIFNYWDLNVDLSLHLPRRLLKYGLQTCQRRTCWSAERSGKSVECFIFWM